MPRKPRVLQPTVVYHVYNRRNEGQLLFPTPRAYDAFVQLLEIGVERYDVRICSYCLMDTHWHQALWVRDADEVTRVTRFLRWLSACHAIRFRLAAGTRGLGHVYQDRYKSKPVSTELHYFALMRYIEQNPLVSGFVTRAEHWRWSSLAERLSGRRRIVGDGPLPLQSNWLEIVNTTTTLEEN